MCGIAGFIGFGDFQISDTSEIAKQMGNAISHRGPDNQGVWKDDGGQMAMVHQRLSILDLSSTGHQPMFSSSGNLVIAFNGEIYNHLDLRTELQKNDLSEIRFRGWRGHSDTETLIVAIETWGLEETLRKSVGMFAFALWNRKEKSLTLVRDRIGEKPLYWGWVNGTFLFGSELKALKRHPHFLGDINRDALALLVNYSPPTTGQLGSALGTRGGAVWSTTPCLSVHRAFGISTLTTPSFSTQRQHTAKVMYTAAFACGSPPATRTGNSRQVELLASTRTWWTTAITARRAIHGTAVFAAASF